VQYPVEVGIPFAARAEDGSPAEAGNSTGRQRQMQRSSNAGDLSLAQAKGGEPVERGRYIGS